MTKQLWLGVGVLVGGLLMFGTLWLTKKPTAEKAATPPENTIGFVEIPITDTVASKAFYEALFNVRLAPRVVDRLNMYFFPMNPLGYGSAAALVYGHIYQPSKQGAVVYFTVKNIDSTVQKALQIGATLNYPITQVDGTMKVAELIDVAGNRIGLQQP